MKVRHHQNAGADLNLCCLGGKPGQGNECILIGLCVQALFHITHMQDVVIDPHRVKAKLFGAYA